MRLALVLNRALASVPITAPILGEAPPLAASPGGGTNGRSAASLACSAMADQQNLHGAERKRFRRACLRDAAAAPGALR